MCIFWVVTRTGPEAKQKMHAGLILPLYTVVGSTLEVGEQLLLFFFLVLGPQIVEDGSFQGTENDFGDDEALTEIPHAFKKSGG